MEISKTSKLSEIKGTFSDAAELMRLIGNPEVMESLNKVKDTAKIVNEIIQGLNTQEMVKNIENFRMISESMSETSGKMENTMNHLRETNVMYDASDLMKSIKDKIDSFNDGSESINGQDVRDVSIASKDMMLSVKDMVNEITLCIEASKKSVIVRNVNHTITEVADISKMVT
ncbi:MAG: hypothetical protein OEM77_02775 [Nitrosopumilus sp.]|nr:hypothetical protein [Nitrosopumilus sp.]MDH3736898.1 hypothetical protein [Nitrosopumilus sp.]MDH3832625.1 hypothetical protein [Nitrosopumilus sp.]